MKLTPEQRDRLPRSAFALPEERKFPIPDLKHARIAVAYAAKQPKAKRDKVMAAVRKKFASSRDWPSMKRWERSQKSARKRSANKNNRPRPAAKNPEQSRRPRWVELGRRVDVMVAFDGKKRLIQLTDQYRLATQPSMSSVFFVECGRPSGAHPGAAAGAWESWTWGSCVDEVREARRPNGGPWKTVGRITAIYYDGRLGESAEGPARRVHHFKKPYPLLQTSPEGFRIARGNGNRRSRYTVTSRGIVG